MPRSAAALLFTDRARRPHAGGRTHAHTHIYINIYMFHSVFLPPSLYDLAFLRTFTEIQEVVVELVPWKLKGFFL